MNLTKSDYVEKRQPNESEKIRDLEGQWLDNLVDKNDDHWTIEHGFAWWFWAILTGIILLTYFVTFCKSF